MFSKKTLRKKMKKVGKKILIQKKGGSNLSNNTKSVFGSNEFHKILWNLFANPNLCVWFKSILNEIHFQFQFFNSMELDITSSNP